MPLNKNPQNPTDKQKMEMAYLEEQAANFFCQTQYAHEEFERCPQVGWRVDDVKWQVFESPVAASLDQDIYLVVVKLEASVKLDNDEHKANIQTAIRNFNRALDLFRPDPKLMDTRPFVNIPDYTGANQKVLNRGLHIRDVDTRPMIYGDTRLMFVRVHGYLRA